MWRLKINESSDLATLFSVASASLSSIPVYWFGVHQSVLLACFAGALLALSRTKPEVSKFGIVSVSGLTVTTLGAAYLVPGVLVILPMFSPAPQFVGFITSLLFQGLITILVEKVPTALGRWLDKIGG